MDYEDEMYQALSKAETGGEKNPYIRTKVKPKGGSTAFGKVQMTKTLIDDYDTRKKLSKESSEFYKTKMKPMYDNFIKHGNNKGKIKDYDADYDYGGTGKFDIKDEESYKNLAKEILKDNAISNKNDDEKVIKAWRGKSRKDDPKYYEKVESELKNIRLEKELTRQLGN